MTSLQTNAVALAQAQNSLFAQYPELQQLINTETCLDCNIQVLNRCVSVIVPTTVDANVPADTSFHVEQTKQFMAELFGGASVSEQEGFYKSSQWGMIREKSVVVRSYTTTATLQQHFPLLLCFVRYLQIQLRQETMGVEMDGKLLIIQFT
ncbi:hypothetical protein PCC9214_05640 [Planktothrix tepida]|uniref:Uncharacterized protein n=1 Tax=Planktothrix tepida PCC 9214 TaxID=671072 RepID=A0A1J1LT15_9CYAN|nr:hypothetical protein [Planktothrix tepida]CAD5989743.1 hypothetical protein PCC9214_05640 [Planktothrix tepida]CUR35543.1 hypothetical protein PL9214670169 [Planktothrix tepida PCC 9214]